MIFTEEPEELENPEDKIPFIDFHNFPKQELEKVKKDIKTIQKHLHQIFTRFLRIILY